MKTERMSFAATLELKKREDAHLLLVKPGKGIFDDYTVIRFSTRPQLEAFNIRAQLKPVVFTEVPKGCAIHKHQKEIAQ